MAIILFFGYLKFKDEAFLSHDSWVESWLGEPTHGGTLWLLLPTRQLGSTCSMEAKVENPTQ